MSQERVDEEARRSLDCARDDKGGRDDKGESGIISLKVVVC